MESCRRLRVGAWKAYYYQDPANIGAHCDAGGATRAYKTELLRELLQQLEPEALKFPPAESGV